MSTKATIKYGENYHLFDDLLDCMDGENTPVYLTIHNVESLEIIKRGKVISLTISIPRNLAREIGILPSITGKTPE